MRYGMVFIHAMDPSSGSAEIKIVMRYHSVWFFLFFIYFPGIISQVLFIYFETIVEGKPSR